jgi:hypothetical protein
MSCSKKNVVQISSKPRLASAWVAMTAKGPISFVQTMQPDPVSVDTITSLPTERARHRRTRSVAEQTV